MLFRSVYSVLTRLLQGLPALEKVSGSWSLVYQFQQTLWTDPCDKNRSFGLFGSAGIGDDNPNPFPWSVSIGLAGSSPLPRRNNDSLGIAYYYMGVNDGLKNLAPRLVPLSDEQGIEMFYSVGVTPWFHLTPDLQIIRGSFERADTAVVVGLRGKIDF